MCVACSRRSDKGDGAKKREQEKKIGVRLGKDVEGTYSLPLPPFCPLLSISSHSPALQWNHALRPPRLYDHLVITTIFFRPKRKNH